MLKLSAFIFICMTSAVTSFAAPDTRTTYDTQPFQTADDPFLTKEGVQGMTFPPRHALLFGAGYAGGNYLTPDEWVLGPSFVLRYAPLDHEKIAWDYQVEINSKNMVGLSLGHRWYCCENDSFNPYARVSVGSYLDGKGEIAGFVDLKRWRARGAVGIGETFISELGVGYALVGFDLYLQFGLQFLFN